VGFDIVFLNLGIVKIWFCSKSRKQKRVVLVVEM